MRSFLIAAVAVCALCVATTADAGVCHKRGGCGAPLRTVVKSVIHRSHRACDQACEAPVEAPCTVKRSCCKRRAGFRLFKNRCCR